MSEDFFEFCTKSDNCVKSYKRALSDFMKQKQQQQQQTSDAI